jgi:ATP-dependent Clp protease protease subunit
MTILDDDRVLLRATRMSEDEEGEKSDDKGGDKMTARMLKTRTIIVAEEVSDKLYRRVVGMLSLLEQKDGDKPIYVYVNSPGGSADSGFAIYDRLRFSPSPVFTIANGLVASSAVLIYLAAEDGKRFALENARFLLHQPSTFTRGQASDIDITAKQIVLLRERYNKIVERHTGKPAATVQQDAERDFWLDSEGAKAYGLANKIITKRSELD